MPMPSYPIAIAIHGQGGRKTRGNTHIRTTRQRRKALISEGDKLVRKFQRAHGIKVDVASDYFWEMCEIDPRFAELNAGLYALRKKYVGY